MVGIDQFLVKTGTLSTADDAWPMKDMKFSVNPQPHTLHTTLHTLLNPTQPYSTLLNPTPPYSSLFIPTHPYSSLLIPRP